MFLGYSSSHLSYRYLDITTQHIYISRHVFFHEQVFPFNKSEQIAQSLCYSLSDPIHLPNFLISSLFHSPTLTTSQPKDHQDPSQSPTLIFAHPQQTTSPALPSPHTCFFNNHTVGTSSDPSTLQRSKSAVIGSPNCLVTASSLSTSDAFIAELLEALVNKKY